MSRCADRLIDLCHWAERDEVEHIALALCGLPRFRDMAPGDAAECFVSEARLRVEQSIY